MNILNFIFHFLLLMQPQEAAFNHDSIRCQLRDFNTSMPLAGALVVFSQDSSFCFSDIDGAFFIPNRTTHIYLAKPGYFSLSLSAADINSDYKINLFPDTLAIDNFELTSFISDVFKHSHQKPFSRNAKILSSAIISSTEWTAAARDKFKYKISDSKGIIPSSEKRYFISDETALAVCDSRGRLSFHDSKKNIASTFDFSVDSSYTHFFPVLSHDFLMLPGAILPSPLSFKNSYLYKYSLLFACSFENDTLITVAFKPASDVYPAFTGWFTASKNTSSLTEIYLQPDSATQIAGFDSLRFYRRYSDKSIPLLQLFSGVHENYFLLDILNIKTSFDSKIYLDNRTNDNSQSSEYSSHFNFYPDVIINNTFSDIDSLKRLDSLENLSAVKVKFLTAFDFNRVGSLTLGIMPKFIYRDLILTPFISYSFGEKKPFGSLNIEYPLLGDDLLTASFSVSSAIETMTNDRSFSRLTNSLIAMSAHIDYYDYYRKDGWTALLNYKPVEGLSLAAQYEQANHFSLKKNIDRSILLTKNIFTGKQWRENPEIQNGRFNFLKLTAEADLADDLSSSMTISQNLLIETAFGRNINTHKSFISFEVRYFLSVPTYSTGYEPMAFDFLINFGRGSANLPLQYQFRMHTELFIFGKFGNIVSAPHEPYGGKAFHSVHLRHKFSDLWWRQLGLPRFKGRGLELYLVFATARFHSNSQKGFLPSFNSLSDISQNYNEIGFSIARIPTFVSNILLLTLDFRWGIGNLADSNFGVGFSFTWPK